MLKKIAVAGAWGAYWSLMAILYFVMIAIGLTAEAWAFAAKKPLEGLAYLSLVVIYSLFAVGILAELNGKYDRVSQADSAEQKGK
jgi:hypothetical protein